MADDLLKWIRFGIETEEKGIEFYTKCLREARHPRAIELFDWLVKVENTHKNILTRLLEAEARYDDAKLQESIREFLESRIENPMFPEETLEKMTRPDTSVREMFNTAMEIEETGIELYNRLEKEQADSSAKALFRRLADDEEEHRKEIRQIGEFVFGIGVVDSYDE